MFRLLASFFYIGSALLAAMLTAPALAAQIPQNASPASPPPDLPQAASAQPPQTQQTPPQKRSDVAFREDVNAFDLGCINRLTDRDPDKLFAFHDVVDKEWKEYPPHSVPWDTWTGTWHSGAVFRGDNGATVVQYGWGVDSGDWALDVHYCYTKHKLERLFLVWSSFTDNDVIEAQQHFETGGSGRLDVSCRAYVHDVAPPNCSRAQDIVNKSLVVYQKPEDLPFGKLLKKFLIFKF